MSMILSLVALGDANIKLVLTDPPLIWRVIAPDDPEIYESARSDIKKSSFFRKLLGYKGKTSQSGSQMRLSGNEGMATDLDKAWHGIHYLLTGSAWEGQPPLNFLLAGGQLVDGVDVGYGPPRIITAAETKAIQQALENVSDETLRSKFKPDDMLAKAIYPEIWHRRPEEDDTLGYLMEYIQILRGFLSQVVDEGYGIVVCIS